MEYNYLSIPAGNSSSVDPNAEPGVEIIKGAASLHPQQLPSVHNLKPSATPVFNSTYRSMFQEWKNSVPKLYKYPSSEIEIVVYRKNGEVGKLTNRDAVDLEKKSGLKEGIAAKSGERSPEEEPCKNLSHLIKNISKSLVISHNPSLGSSMSLLTEDGKYDEYILSSPSPTSLPHFPFQLNQQLVSARAKKMFTITPVGQEVYPRSHNAIYVSSMTGVRDSKPGLSSKAKPQQASAFVKPVMPQATKNEKNRPELDDSPQRNDMRGDFKRSSIETMTDDTMDRSVQMYSKVIHASVQTTKAPTSTSFVQTGRRPDVIDFSSQTLPTSVYQVTQTDVKPQKAVIALECQTELTMSSQESQTDLKSQKSVMEFGCQSVPAISYDPEPQISMMEFGSQMAPSFSYQGCQTEAEALENATCQASPTLLTQSNQSEQDVLNPVANKECQAVVGMESKPSQAEAETMEIAIQCKPSRENKGVQLSGACCYVLEKRIEKYFTKILRFWIRKMHLSPHLDEVKDASAGKPNGNADPLKGSISTEELDGLVDKFNALQETKNNREELHFQLAEMTQQLTLSINSLSTTQTTEYFEDDILDSSNTA